VDDTHPGPALAPVGGLWPGRRELRADLRPALGLAALLTLTGLPAGLLWWWLAPRAEFRVGADGPVVIGRPSLELSIAVDSVLVLILAGLGVLAGTLAWRVRRRRGVALLAGLAVGTAAAAAIAWQVGELLAPPPTAAELADVGRVVTTPVRLSGLPALAVAPFSAVLAYLVGALVAHDDDLGRTDGQTGDASSGGAAGAASAGEEPVDAGAR
jgi:hypothetical protein